MADTVGTAEVLASLLRDTAISTAVPNTLVYFRVDKMLPASDSSLRVDPRHSAMTMKVQHLPHCAPGRPALYSLWHLSHLKHCFM